MANKPTSGAAASQAVVRSNSAQPAVAQPQVLARLLGNSSLLSNDQAAAYIGVTPGTLEVWRCTNRYKISYIKVGRLVKYRQSVLDAWLLAQTVSRGEV